MGWVNIKDSLPEENIMVLVIGKPIKQNDVDYLGPYMGYIKDGVWYDNTRIMFEPFYYIKITHWHRLPEFPKMK